MDRKRLNNKPWRAFILAISIGVIIAGSYFATQLESNFSLNQFAYEQPQELANYEKYNRLFKKGKSPIIIGLKSIQPIQDISQFKELEKLRSRLDSIQGVQKSHFLTNIPYKAQLGPLVIDDPFLPLDKKTIFDLRYSTLNEFPDITPKFISTDRHSVCIYLFLDNQHSPKTMREIRAQVNKTTFIEKHIVGKTIAEKRIKTSIEDEVVRLTIIGLILILIVFFLIHPSIRSLVFFGWLVLLSVSTFYLSLWCFNIQLNTLTSTVPLLITVLALSDAIHILNAYHSEHQPKKTNVFQKIGLPLVLTSLTTAMGFAVFLFTGYSIVIEFALLAIMGIITSYIVARFFSPLLFPLLAKKPPKTIIDFKNVIQFVNLIAQKKAKIIVSVCTTLILGGSYFVITQLQVDHFRYGELEKGSEQEKSIRFYEQSFGGTRKISLFISSENGMLNPKGIETIKSIENYLTTYYHASNITSINTAIKRYNRFKHAGAPNYFTIPNNLSQHDLDAVYRLKSDLGLESSISKNKKSIRIIASTLDEGSSTTAVKNQKLRKFLERTLNEHTFYLGGPTTIQDKAITNITNYLIYGILGALILVTIFLTLLFRSVTFGLIGIVANSLPLLGVLLLYVVFQVDLNPMNVMLLSIVLGVAIDDTIYLLGGVLMNRKDPEKDINLKFQKTLRDTGKPIVTTTLLLMAGFFALSFSSFQSNQENSLFFILALLFALLADLLFIPAILSLKYRSKNH